MDNTPDTMAKMSEEQMRAKIKKLEDKVDTTKYNMEVSKEIIAETPSDAQQEELTRRNIRREHGIASIEKEISDIKQKIEEM
ncbi:MAG: small, acid-soluble spore protein tlp [Angelakisella sp.]|nr:small, acid-soluble spore protein tlp [Angelakisella sp.]